VTDLERSHAELRVALILAGKEIRRLNFGKVGNPVFAIMRRVLWDARSVSRKRVSIVISLVDRRSQR
jgi:hypothetical protein